MENNVVSLETAKKLKAAGFPQETYFAWIGNDVRHMPSGARTEREPALPTAQEIADQLPRIYRQDEYPQESSFGVWSHGESDWVAYYSDGEADVDELCAYRPTMAEALASLWLAIQGEK